MLQVYICLNCLFKALEVLLDELSKHLDEDMNDLDLHEQGMQQNVHQWLASEEALHV